MMAAVATIVLLGAYLWGVQRYKTRFRHRSFNAWRIAAFVAGAVLLAVAFEPPLHSLADGSFSWHMLQHLIVMFVAPPLMLLGAPLLLLVSATPVQAARVFTSLAHSAAGNALFAPVTGWLAFVFVLWGVHFSPLYELALEYPAVHVLEHALFFVAGLLFWGAVVQVGYAPRPVAFPARMLFLFLALPQGAFVAFAIGASTHPLYAHYATSGVAAALADQRSGADLMWIAGGFILFVAFMCEGAAWAFAERRVESAA